MIFQKFDKSYYKYKIILTFSIVTIFLVFVLSQFSYRFIKNLYLTQISENLSKNLVLTFGQIDKIQLEILQSEIITKSTLNYFYGFFNKPDLQNIFSEIFIFDKDFKVISHSNKRELIGKVEPRLLLNEIEIKSLLENEIFTSLPFKGNDENWYLWGFYKLSENYVLAVKDNVKNFSSLEELSNFLIYFGIFGIIFSILLGFWVSKSITNPIYKLVEFSDEIGKGNYNSEIPEKTKGEIEILSNALILMRNNIKNNNNEKEKILAQIAHEIRNPLGGIELLINLIKESPKDEIKNAEYTNKILDEISNLKELITSYLNFSKPYPVVSEKLNIEEMVKDIIEILKNELISRNIEVITNFAQKNIFFDKSQFRSILINLLKNSIDSINQNGEIEISSKLKERNIVIEIKDTGSGISKENFSRIFEPFFTTKINGTGLGLATCKKYCDENNALISAESFKNKTIFTISKKL
ncbi:MAG: HAMP domain-containing histidine kinase [Ignavibacteriae bacterium]|nr:HAMP domain-containing histidine kinase [Ignavibacteriota bacterium]